jgi:hypothetical protein
MLSSFTQTPCFELSIHGSVNDGLRAQGTAHRHRCFVGNPTKHPGPTPSTQSFSSLKLVLQLGSYIRIREYIG